MKEGYSSMNHKRLAAALLTALALTTLPAMGTAFAEDGVDAYGRPTRPQELSRKIRPSPSPSLHPIHRNLRKIRLRKHRNQHRRKKKTMKTVKMQTSLFPPFPQARPIKAKALSSPSTYSLPKQSPNPSTTLSSLQ